MADYQHKNYGMGFKVDPLCPPDVWYMLSPDMLIVPPSMKKVAWKVIYGEGMTSDPVQDAVDKAVQLIKRG